jgi:hypothetical protein
MTIHAPRAVHARVGCAQVCAPLLEPTVLSVSDEQIRAAMRLALIELKQVPDDD